MGKRRVDRLKAGVPVCGMETGKDVEEAWTISTAKGRGSRLRDGNTTECTKGETLDRLKAGVPVCGMETSMILTPVADFSWLKAGVPVCGMETRFWRCQFVPGAGLAKGRGSRLRDGNPTWLRNKTALSQWLNAGVPVCGMETVKAILVQLVYLRG